MPNLLPYLAITEGKQPRLPLAIVAAADKAREKVIGVCLPSDNLTSFAFGTAAQHYLIKYEGKDPMEVDTSRVKIKVLAIVRQPAHGRLFMDENDPVGGGVYYPDQGYLGKDRVEAIVSVGEDVVRVVFNFVVSQIPTDQLERSEKKALCPKGLYWKISENPPGPVADAATSYRKGSTI